MCFWTPGGTGPQSSADVQTGGYRPPGNPHKGGSGNAGNPHSDAATPQGRRSATQSQQTADRNTMRRAGQTSAVASGQKTMNALNDYNKANKKTILGS